MAALGVVLDDLFQALSKASATPSGGYVERGARAVRDPQRSAPSQSLDDIGKVRVGFHDGVPVSCSDVATVTDGYAPRQGVVTRGDNEDAVEGIVLMRRGREPVGRARRRCASGSTSCNARVAARRACKINAVLRPHRARRHDARDRVPQPGRGRDAGHARAVRLPAVAARVADRGAGDPALARGVVHLPARRAACRANLLSMGAVDFGIIVDGAVILVEHVFGHCAGRRVPAR